MIDINFVLNHSVKRPFNFFAPGNLKGCIINFRALGSLFPNVVNGKFINEPTGGTCQKIGYTLLSGRPRFLSLHPLTQRPTTNYKQTFRRSIQTLNARYIYTAKTH